MHVKLPPLALYVHVPWCVRKCSYCDFNSYPLVGEIPESVFITALLQDLELDLIRYQATGRPLVSIFIGGGTPSLLSGSTIKRLLQGIYALCPVQTNLEITIEANPGTANARRFADYLAAGVNRLSIGVQTFNAGQLQALGRMHGAADAIAAIVLAKNVGWVNLNVDLMFGIPNQTLESALQDLSQTLELGPTHISWYELTLEPGTPLFQARPKLPGEKLLWQLHKSGLRLLKANGFKRYEVSAYARDGNHCQHNMNYWQFGDYLGIGPGAHGKITGLDGRVQRMSKREEPHVYLASSGKDAFLASASYLTADDLCEEFLFNALRLCDGFSLSLFATRTGLEPGHLTSRLAKAEKAALITNRGELVRATPMGYRLLNQLLLMLFSSSS